jgi:hypothetical protein
MRSEAQALGGFSKFAMHFARTPDGWQFTRLGQERQGTVVRRPE